MTKWNTIKVTCPACLEDGDFRICSFADIEANPDLKESIFNRSLFKYTCAECGEEILVAYDCTYLDKSRNVMVSLLSDNQSSPTVEVSGCTLRIVRSINEFVEKIALIEDNIDDRVVELYKIMLEDQFEEERNGCEILGIFYGGINPDDKSLIFYIITGNSANCRAVLSYDTYTTIAEQFKDSAKADADCVEINRVWAVTALQKGFSADDSKD